MPKQFGGSQRRIPLASVDHNTSTSTHLQEDVSFQPPPVLHDCWKEGNAGLVDGSFPLLGRMRHKSLLSFSNAQPKLRSVAQQALITCRLEKP